MCRLGYSYKSGTDEYRLMCIGYVSARGEFAPKFLHYIVLRADEAVWACLGLTARAATRQSRHVCRRGLACSTLYHHSDLKLRNPF